MLKKQEIIDALENGGSIMFDTIYRTARVLDANREEIGTCRYDTAERIERMEGYKTRKTDWYATRFVEKDWDAVSARVMAAVTETFQAMERAGIISDLEIEPMTAAQVSEASAALEAAEELPDAWQPAPGRVAVRDARTDEIIEGSPRAVYYALQFRYRRDRYDGEPVAAWEPVNEGAAAVIAAAIAATERNQGDALRCAAEEAATSQEAPAAEKAPAAPEPDPQDARPAKVYFNERTGEREERASVAMGWHRAGDAVRVDTRDAYWGELLHRVTIQGAPQEPKRSREDENRAHCRHIAEEIDAHARGELKRCPECGEIHRRDWDDIADVFRCPECGAITSIDDWDTCSLWEFFDDAYDIEFRVGSDRRYRSVRVMVACGGPNIYIDTASKNVELYWWGERAWYPISYDAVEIIDEWAEEIWGCM
jgi:predicted RNA-binding Zn-ribbon protein involved in translation (DUF1610 family)